VINIQVYPSLIPEKERDAMETIWLETRFACLTA
jgi:hypothetical protein